MQCREGLQVVSNSRAEGLQKLMIALILAGYGCRQTVRRNHCCWAYLSEGCAPGRVQTVVATLQLHVALAAWRASSATSSSGRPAAAAAHATCKHQ